MRKNHQMPFGGQEMWLRERQQRSPNAPMTRTRKPLNTNIQLANYLLFIFVNNTSLLEFSTFCGGRNLA